MTLNWKEPDRLHVGRFGRWTVHRVRCARPVRRGVGRARRPGARGGRAGVRRIPSSACRRARGVPRSHRRLRSVSATISSTWRTSRPHCLAHVWQPSAHAPSAQLRMFANVVREGSWVDARIDRAIPDRKPLPKPDIRRMLIPIGPGRRLRRQQLPAGVLGGRRRYGVGARCRVSRRRERPSRASGDVGAGRSGDRQRSRVHRDAAWGVLAASEHTQRHRRSRSCGIHGRRRWVSPEASAPAGRCSTPPPAALIRFPVYAEMGSVNPVFLLPGALAERGDAIAEGLVNSVDAGRWAVLHESRPDDRHRRRGASIAVRASAARS